MFTYNILFVKCEQYNEGKSLESDLIFQKVIPRKCATLTNVIDYVNFCFGILIHYTRN